MDLEKEITEGGKGCNEGKTTWEPTRAIPLPRQGNPALGYEGLLGQDIVEPPDFSRRTISILYEMAFRKTRTTNPSLRPSREADECRQPSRQKELPRILWESRHIVS